MIGVRPAVGGFSPDDFTVSSSSARIEPRILLDDLFRSQYGGDASVIGRTVVLDASSGRGYRVVGVMPRGFVSPSDTWTVGFLAPYVPTPRLPAPPELTEVVARLPATGALIPALRASRIDPTRALRTD